jgi:hypothetical protein
MALATSSFQLLHHGGAQNVWIYHTADAQATVAGANYFDGLRAAGFSVQKSDVIIVVGATGGTPTLQNYVVTAASATAITVATQILA